MRKERTEKWIRRENNPGVYVYIRVCVCARARACLEARKARQEIALTDRAWLSRDDESCLEIFEMITRNHGTFERSRCACVYARMRE